MAIHQLQAKFTGISPLLLNNPRGVNPLDKIGAEAAKAYAAWKKSKTEDAFIHYGQMSARAKLYWDEDLGIYIPSRWVIASLAKNSFKVLQSKGSSAAAVRGSIFAVEERCKLRYDGIKSVKKMEDVWKNDRFLTILNLPQGKVRLPKTFPIFHRWSFLLTLEYDSKIFESDQITRVLEYSAKYGGFGDFRPTYGRALCEVEA